MTDPGNDALALEVSDVNGGRRADGSVSGEAPDAGVVRPETKRSTATLLVDLAEQRWRFGTDQQGRPFAVPVDGPPVARSLQASGPESLIAQLASQYTELFGNVPNSNALRDARTVLEGRAGVNGRETVFTRVGYHDGQIIIDLGSPSGRCVFIRPGAFEVCDRSPVVFRRTELTSELPEPKAGGTPEELGELLNVCTDDLRLVWGWLVGVIVDSPQPILLLTGEQGTGKTGAAKVIAQLVDPSPAPVRAAPTTLDQWATAALGSHLVALDNLSKVEPWFSDALCRAVTGEGLLKRQLYTDDQISILEFRRSVILTSIDPGALRGDLVERFCHAELQVIPTTTRRTEADIGSRFNERHPYLLGVLCCMVAEVLADLPDLELAELPRMADFGRVLAALDKRRSWTTFDRYCNALALATNDVLAGDPLGEVINVFLSQNGDHWQGSAGELHSHLARLIPEGAAFPKTPGTLSSALMRLAPALRASGVDVRRHRTNSRRVVELARVNAPET